MAKYRVKQNLLGKNVERRIVGHGNVIFNSDKVKEENYEKYVEMGFDCFEEVEQEQEVNLDKMKKAELEKFAEENGFEIEGAPTKAQLIELLKAEIK